MNQMAPERFILNRFELAGMATIPTATLFDREFPNADVVRTLGMLENEGRLIRYTWDGTDWVTLTPQRAKAPNAMSRRSAAAPPEIIATHPHLFRGNDSTDYRAYILGAPRHDGTWSGWLEFVPIGDGVRRQTSQETSQPNRDALAYWASGLEDLYLEGALRRSTVRPAQ